MFTNRKRVVGALGALFVVGTVAGIGFSHGRDSSPVSAAQAAETAAPTVIEVDVATVLSQTITDWQSYSGRLEAVDHVDVVRLFQAPSSRCTSRTAL
jgi:multidrug efflux system membrane fusion protein